MPKSIIDLPLEKITEIIEGSETVDDVIIRLHKSVIGEEKFNSMDKLFGFVRTSKNTWEEICKLLNKKFTYKAGFIWMNYGFSVNNNIEDFKVDISEAINIKETFNG